MGFREDLLPTIFDIKTAVFDAINIRTSQLTIRQRTWAGGRPGSADGVAHLYPTTIAVAATAAVDLPSVLITLNALATAYMLHIVDLKQHPVADSSDGITLPAAIDLATAIALANQFKTNYNLHRVSTTAHWNADTANNVVAVNAVDLGTLLTLVNSILVAFKAHIAINAITDVDLVLPKIYRIRQVTAQEISSTGGRYEAGDIVVEHITPADGNGVGYTPAQLKPRPTTNATEVIYIVTPDSATTDGLAGQYGLRELRSWRPFSFDLVLKRTEQTP